MNERDIFIEAIQQALADREAYLDRACGGDSAIRRRVDTLIAAHEQAGSFLEGVTLDPTSAQVPLTEAPGTTIGPYKLLEQIGEGGFGVVFMAEQQQPLRRKVALKVIKAGMDTKQVIARFEAERQALALMDHPNIAKVLDAGATASGRPYFVMELVRGVPITAYCDEAHLNPRERLELFVHVCHAVQHAHQKGIIHRDIKPSNVLITLHDGKPMVKVIDFGIAKATGQQLTERTLFTNFAQMVGTPLYMSPEQAGAGTDIDTRSDIYGLGVLLYELLTGSTPFDKERLKSAAFEEIRRIIREEEPPRPSTRLSGSATLASVAAMCKTEPKRLSHLFRGEVDWIVMKALEKDRNRRYETANGFAMDVQRYLNDEAVEACPPSAMYRFRKLASRNKQSLSMAAVVAVAVLIAVATLGWSVRDREAREETIAQDAARRLAASEQGITQAIDRASASRAELHAILNRPGGVQSLLNQPVRWQLLIESARGELAHARRLDSHAEGQLDDLLTSSLAELDEAILRDERDCNLAMRLEDIRAASAVWVDSRFDYQNSAAAYEDAFAGFAVFTGDPNAVAALVVSSPIKDQLVAALDHWSFILPEPNRRKREQLLAIARLAAPDPHWGDRVRQTEVRNNVEALRALIAEAPIATLSPQMLQLVGYLVHDDAALAESWKRRARASHPSDFWLNFSLAETIGASHPMEAAGYYRVALAVRPGNAAAHNNLGRILFDLRQLKESIAAYQQALEMDPSFVVAWTNLGNALAADGNNPQALAAHRKAIALDATSSAAHYWFASALGEQGKLDEAEAEYREAIRLKPGDGYLHNGLGSFLFEHKRGDNAAEQLFREAIRLEPTEAIYQLNLGNALHRQGKLDDAIGAYRTAVLLNADIPDGQKYLAGRLVERGAWKEAADAYRKAIALEPANGALHAYLGTALRNQNLLDDAIVAYRQAVALAPEQPNFHNSLGALLCDHKRDYAAASRSFSEAIRLKPDVASYRCNLGNALRGERRLDDAIAAYRKAIELDANDHVSHYQLALTLNDQGKPAEAIAAFERAIELKPLEASGLNQLAILLARPELPQHDSKRAVELAQRALELEPRNGAFASTLGMALYRAGQYDDALAALTMSVQLSGKEGAAGRSLFFAMAHWRMGKREEARTHFDEVTALMKSNPIHTDALRRVHAEAAKLLGVPEKKD